MAARLQESAGEATVRERHRRVRFARARATYLLVGINVAVYLWMVLAHVNPFSPSVLDLVKFGGNNVLLVLLHGEWWRVITAMFVHVGLLHLATNMWCLWNLGLLGEPLLGFFGVCAVYLLSGAAGNLLSLAVNLFTLRASNPGQELQVGAGASGAVFGLAGILIVLFSNKRLSMPRGGFSGIPLQDLYSIRRSVISFAVLNLLLGGSTAIGPLMRGLHLTGLHIDNMAHLGGFIAGLVMGVPLLSRMTTGRRRYLQRQKAVFGATAFFLLLVADFLQKITH